MMKNGMKERLGDGRGRWGGIVVQEDGYGSLTLTEFLSTCCIPRNVLVTDALFVAFEH